MDYLVGGRPGCRLRAARPANYLSPWSTILMNIKDWQKAKEEHKRSVRKDSPHVATPGMTPVPARIDVLVAELAAIAAQPPVEEVAAEKPNS